MKKKKKISKNLPLLIYKHFVEVLSRAYDASHKVLEENRRLGIPSPFSLQGRIYYLMPDGRIVLKSKQSKNFSKERRG